MACNENVDYLFYSQDEHLKQKDGRLTSLYALYLFETEPSQRNGSGFYDWFSSTVIAPIEDL